MFIIFLILSETSVKSISSPEAESLYALATNMENPLKAMEIYRKLVVHYPDLAYADSSMFRIGMFYYIMNDYSQALKSFKIIEKKGKDSPLFKKVRFWIGVCYSLLGDSVKAAKYKKGEEPKKEGEGCFAVQVGAFRVKTWANNLMQRLKLAGFEPFQMKSKSGLMKVMVGRFKNREDAVLALDALNARGFEGFILNLCHH
ncbi:MAG TPA: hypothetical protein ENL19_01865 [candidate division WOR-3 bacterium]|uniref:SPOR domain-containing protein n=1 Tax=candidate division WOR-3 bacterium TaxID=2052148 RepID=A0A7C5HG64_UNCW3|nr:hypothetical protein [candidate division WOR-3 bacterium]